MRISDWSSDVCSSDLAAVIRAHLDRADRAAVARVDQHGGGGDAGFPALAPLPQRDHRRQQRGALVGEAVFDLAPILGHRRAHQDRSEEHTSELQSLMRISYAVFCLKKKITIRN